MGQRGADMGSSTAVTRVSRAMLETQMKFKVF